MGAYVSRGQCEAHYNVTLNCNVTYWDKNKTIIRQQGDLTEGQFEGDPDIAGIGIFWAFISVTSLALGLSFLVVIFSMIKHSIFPFQKCCDSCIADETPSPGSAPHSKPKAKTALRIMQMTSEIFQGMVVSCSDAQIFTGAAYALTLRYFRGCTITAYHYNIVANMMLLTCATHLMAITVVRAYWEHPWLALLRAVCKTGVFLVTGLLLSNQNADLEDKFPTGIPPMNDKSSPLLLAAACFQSEETELGETLRTSLQHQNAKNAFLFSTPGNRIEGWNKYLIILLWYLVAVMFELAMFIRKGSSRPGSRRRWLVEQFWKMAVAITNKVKECLCCFKRAPVDKDKHKTIRRLKRVGHYALSLYYLGGIGICIWTVADAGRYIGHLRQWVQDSGWMAKDDGKVTPEDDATSFGQLVPIFTSGLVLFTLLAMLTTICTGRRDERNRCKVDEEHVPLQVAQNSCDAQYTSEPKPTVTVSSAELISPQESMTHVTQSPPQHQNPPQGSSSSPFDTQSGVSPGAVELGSGSPAASEQTKPPEKRE